MNAAEVYVPPAIIEPFRAKANQAVADSAMIERVLLVLLQLEPFNGGWDQPGGAFQFTLRSWQEQTGLPYTLARHRETAMNIARKRLQVAIATARRFNVEPTPILLIGSWRHGLAGAMRKLKTGKPSPYMRNGLNLYNDPTL